MFYWRKLVRLWNKTTWQRWQYISYPLVRWTKCTESSTHLRWKCSFVVWNKTNVWMSKFLYADKCFTRLRKKKKTEELFPHWLKKIGIILLLFVRTMMLFEIQIATFWPSVFNKRRAQMIVILIARLSAVIVRF